MATFRVGVGSFSIKTDGSVGIGTEGTGHGNLRVEGTLKSTSSDVLGVSTFTRYSGFNADEVKVSNRDLSLSGEYSTTGDIVVESGASLTVGVGSTACVGTVECIHVKNHFSVPSGDIAQRNESVGYSEGCIRYNVDLGTMEFFNGTEWKQFRYVSDVTGSNRAVIFRGVDQGMEFFNIMTLGNTSHFGFMETSHQISASFGSKTRGIVAGGYSGSDSNNSQPRIEYITLASQGTATLFGSLSNSTFRNSGGCSSSTRGLIIGGGYPSYYNVIESVEINTLGNATDFGDSSDTNAWRRCLSSPTRGVYKGGFPLANVDGMQYVTIASKGNSTKFGDLIQPHTGGDACSNSVRGIFAGGYAPNQGGPALTNIQYLTIASEGDTIHFGDLYIGADDPSAVANQVRAVLSGGYSNPTSITRMEYITIATAGDAQDFGDLGLGIDRRATATSDSHGGLGGY